MVETMINKWVVSHREMYGKEDIMDPIVIGSPEVVKNIKWSYVRDGETRTVKNINFNNYRYLVGEIELDCDNLHMFENALKYAKEVRVGRTQNLTSYVQILINTDLLNIESSIVVEKDIQEKLNEYMPPVACFVFTIPKLNASDTLQLKFEKESDLYYLSELANCAIVSTPKGYYMINLDRRYGEEVVSHIYDSYNNQGNMMYHEEKEDHLRLHMFFSMIGGTSISERTWFIPYTYVPENSHAIHNKIKKSHRSTTNNHHVIIDVTTDWIAGITKCVDTTEIEPSREPYTRSFCINLAKSQLVEVEMDSGSILTHDEFIMYGLAKVRINSTGTSSNMTTNYETSHMLSSGYSVVRMHKDIDLHNLDIYNNIKAVTYIVNGKPLTITPLLNAVNPKPVRNLPMYEFEDYTTRNEVMDNIIYPLYDSVCPKEVAFSIHYCDMMKKVVMSDDLFPHREYDTMIQVPVNIGNSKYIALVQTDGRHDRVKEERMFGFVDLQDDTFHSTEDVYSGYMNYFTTHLDPLLVTDIIGHYHHIQKPCVQNDIETLTNYGALTMVRGSHGLVMTDPDHIYFWNKDALSFTIFDEYGIHKTAGRREIFCSMGTSLYDMMLYIPVSNSSVADKLFGEEQEMVLSVVLGCNSHQPNATRGVLLSHVEPTYSGVADTYIFHVLGLKTPFAYVINPNRLRELYEDEDTVVWDASTLLSNTQYAVSDYYGDESHIGERFFAVDVTFPASIEEIWYAGVWRSVSDRLRTIANDMFLRDDALYGDYFTIYSREMIKGVPNRKIYDVRLVTTLPSALDRRDFYNELRSSLVILSGGTFLMKNNASSIVTVHPIVGEQVTIEINPDFKNPVKYTIEDIIKWFPHR